MSVFCGEYSLIIAKSCFCHEKLFLTCELHYIFRNEFRTESRHTMRI